MSEFPLGYHITFGTYGTRLHGDARGTVRRAMNQWGEPIMGRDEEWQRMEARLLRFPPVVLSTEQRLRGEAVIPAICERGGWTYHAAACRADHVHVLLSAVVEGKGVRRWLKAWLGQAMTERWALPEGATWWAECGSVKWAWEEGYFRNILEYIEGQRTTPE